MGYSSYRCKHCDEGILSEDATDKGINEWMAEVVMLSPNGNMVVDTGYSGYEGHYEKFSMNNSVWAHKACWELAGKPEYDAYDGPSPSDPNQGSGGKEALIVDPRIKDEAERERVLAEGMARRNQRLFELRANYVEDWIAQAKRKYYIKKLDGEMWRLRFDYFETTEYGDDHTPLRPKDGTMWYVSDRLDVDFDKTDDARIFRDTEDELKTHLAKTWADFLESDECKEYLAFRKKQRDKHRAAEVEKCKTEGRYEVTYGPRRDKDGKEIWPCHFVHDKLYLMDDRSLRDEFWHGDGSAEKAQEKADRMNAEWAASGYEVDWSRADDDEEDDDE